MLNVVKSPYRTAYENLAFEQELLRTGTPFLFTHRDAPCVSVGFNQDIEAEVDAALAKEWVSTSFGGKAAAGRSTATRGAWHSRWRCRVISFRAPWRFPSGP